MHSIEVSDEVFAWLQSQARPLQDTADSVLRRFLPMDGTMPSQRAGGWSDVHTPGGRLKKGHLLPTADYEIPLLESLVELGGRAPTNEVLDLLETKIKDRLTEFDFVLMRRGRTVIKWRNRAQFVRLHLIRVGDMAADSPRGIWEITIQGRKRLGLS